MKRYKIIILLAFLLFLPSLILVGSSERSSSGAGEQTRKDARFVLPQKRDTGLTREEENGKVLYEYYCALCHGKEGNADGFNAYNLKTAPIQHSDPAQTGTLSDGQIRRIIKEGGGALGRSTEMPAWGGVLSDEQISHITTFIRTLSRPADGRKNP